MRRVSRATVTDASGHLELEVVFALSYYPATVENAQLTVRWYTNDDFKLHYREEHSNHARECRWDRHPNHLRPQPAVWTPGEDASRADDHRDVVALVLDEIEDRIAALWAE